MSAILTSCCCAPRRAPRISHSSVTIFACGSMAVCIVGSNRRATVCDIAISRTITALLWHAPLPHYYGIMITPLWHHYHADIGTRRWLLRGHRTDGTIRLRPSMTVEQSAVNLPLVVTIVATVFVAFVILDLSSLGVLSDIMYSLSMLCTCCGALDSVGLNTLV